MPPAAINSALTAPAGTSPPTSLTQARKCRLTVIEWKVDWRAAFVKKCWFRMPELKGTCRTSNLDNCIVTATWCLKQLLYARDFLARQPSSNSDSGYVGSAAPHINPGSAKSLGDNALFATSSNCA